MENHPMTSTKPANKRPRRMAREPEQQMSRALVPQGNHVAPTPAPASAKQQTKSDLVLELLARADGATIDQLIAATGWLPHTTRAMLTGLKKKGHIIASEKPTEGKRIYRTTGKADVS
jgi:hypothetical protein